MRHPAYALTAVTVLFGASVGAAQTPPVAPYKSLFVRDATWTLPCTKVPGGPGASSNTSPSKDNDLECKVVDLKSIGGATLIHLTCTGNTANPTGWYAMTDRGLYDLSRFTSPTDDPPRPRVRWTDYESPNGNFQAVDVARLSAGRPLMAAKPTVTSWRDPPHPSGWQGGGSTTSDGAVWCSERHGSNGGGGSGLTLCVSKAGLAGTGWWKGESIFSYRCGAAKDE